VGRRQDATLAAAGLAAVAAAAAALGAPPDPTCALWGAVGALALEWLLSRDATRVRRIWSRPSVRAGAVTLAVLGSALGVREVGVRVLIALGGGLVAYLLLLGVVHVRERDTPGP
jgi:hypothetical protein